MRLDLPPVQLTEAAQGTCPARLCDGRQPLPDRIQGDKLDAFIVLRNDLRGTETAANQFECEDIPHASPSLSFGHRCSFGGADHPASTARQ
jgi:hypothetical protein